MTLTIDTANAMQIRPAMDVVCSMTIETDAQIQSYSSATAKLYDQVTVDGFPMRALADLQGEGFPLDGSCELYEQKSASAENGKLGLRTTLGTYGRIRIVGNKKMEAVTVKARGTGSIRVNSTTGDDSTIVDGGSTIVPIGASSAYLYFFSDDETRRIEVESLEPGAKFEITNENLISCQVSLRSDLTVLNPTFPASEITIEMTYPDDLSEMLVDVEEGTPITYSAGYPGSMSPERKFYLEDQGAEYEQGKLTIKGQDATHKLDEDIVERYSSLEDDYAVRDEIEMRAEYLHQDIYLLVKSWLAKAGVDVTAEMKPWRTGKKMTVSPNRNKNVFFAKPLREWIAYFMSALHQDYSSGLFYEGGNPGAVDHDVGRAFWLTYVDAGIPTLTWSKPSAEKWTVEEEDLGDLKTNVERYYNELYQNIKGLVWSKVPPADENGYMEEISDEIPHDEVVRWYPSDRCKNYHARYMRKSSETWLPEDSFSGMIKYQALNFVDIEWPTIVMWDYEIPKRIITAQKAAEVDCYERMTYERTGVKGEVDFEWIGDATIGRGDVGLYASNKDGSSITKIIPGNYAFLSVFHKSRRTGSFTYKGDPRWQPRDLLKIRKRDGTSLLVTIENITLKHEKGGLSAEVTYREGVV